ncbi:GntR family transcriptional regulator [Streptomyces sp. RPA4-5]|uniref:GntR family transcriptional regulator n=1 Tax=Streptomyces sp. RPA4-5 TaxID=2721245 RepID=UPI00143E5F32|nr:GntR family transcriptional regulator [Streptomyces sp. RPA4-5]QIY59032.1 GntR family transcriptional regulator [Streptomyces sp. RPA4-5]
MTTATTDHATAQSLDPRQLRDDLLVLRRVSGNRMQAAPACVARNCDMVRLIARHWAPFGHTRRAAATGSAAEEQRWDILLARADPERSVEQCYADVVAYAYAVREFVQALHEAIRPGTTVPEVARSITAAVAKGDLPVGFELRVKQVAAVLRAPAEAVRAAMSSLVDSNRLERRSRRIFPAGSLQMHDALATHIADRLRAQIATGVYARGSRLPSAKFLATTVCSDSAPVGRALRILDAEGTVHIGPRGTKVSQPARPTPRPAPTAPHHDEKNPRFSRDTIVATCRAAHEQWRRRGPAPAEVLHGRWQDLRSMAGQLLAAAPAPAPDVTQELASLARAAELASAPLPDEPWLQQWHTACLAKSISDILPLIPKEPR